jgi:hypothetical protein
MLGQLGNAEVCGTDMTVNLNPTLLGKYNSSVLVQWDFSGGDRIDMEPLEWTHNGTGIIKNVKSCYLPVKFTWQDCRLWLD